ncbi:filament integrity protein fraC [Fischerella thermalis CCMEE 5268]|uniref:Filament integrity protein fraC n=1 Tax=Fischerella thermalis CCMEE 5268 TaxID=2019662 RepID=A0A2N6KHL1_9CYAN|nr:filament integrity protein FraC [Fischerella thermalis]PLZ98895.1 filament integrity protein fraC [Fischerella thermalis CCMEE 5268]
MLDFPLLPKVLPLGAILFSFLFLLISIPLEAYILNSILKFDKKTSSFYAICMNLFSNVIGWAIFFLIEPLLSIRLRTGIINLMFFNQISPTLFNLLILIAFIVFFGTFLVKSLVLRVALISLTDFWQKQPDSTPQKFYSRRDFKRKLQTKNIFTSVLIANALSYTAVVLVLFLILRIV